MTDVAAFIQDELRKRKHDYTSSPAYILEHYKIEKESVQAYNGRQLLEMLQNADDASETAKDKKARITLKGNLLTISNNGEPFSIDGLRSIIYSNLSIKTTQKNKIGHKGLGFKSILSWADEITISSGKTCIAFSEKIAKDYLQEVLAQAPAVAHFLKKKYKVSNPIAVLRIPKLIEDHSIVESDFDTTISIKLKKNVLSEVRKQIKTIITMETMVFMNNINTIEIDSTVCDARFKRTISGRDKSNISVKHTTLLDKPIAEKSWHVKRKKGEHKTKKWELAIAWNDKLDDKENVLFSYFKTEARFPFPALLHGTFELTPDRNQLVKDTEGHNEYLIGELTELLIETALAVANEGTANYSPLKLLNIDYDKMDSTLLGFKFKDKLIARIKCTKIFPSVNKTYNTHAVNPVFYNLPIAKIAIGDDVMNLMPVCEESSTISFLTSLGKYHYSLKKFSAIIAKRVESISIPELARWIYYLLEYKPYWDELNKSNFILANLDCFLIDSQNQTINWGKNIFLGQETVESFLLPPSLNIHFLHPDLVDALLKVFAYSKPKKLLEKLDPLGVREFSFSEIVESLVLHYNSVESISKRKVIELHTFLFRLYKIEAASKEPEKLRFADSLPVISIGKHIVKADTAYFGKSYGHSLTERLYTYNKAKILARSSEFDLQNEDSELVKKYFDWIGIAELPRKTLTIPSDEFCDYTLKRFDYRHGISDKSIRSYQELRNLLNHYGASSVQTIDDIDLLLASNDSETIIAWLYTDEKIKVFLERDTEPKSSTLQIKFGQDYNYREIHGGQIKNYLKWKVSTSTWLSTESGIRQAPKLCTTSATITEVFSPLIEKPKIDFEALILRTIGFNDRLGKHMLAMIGVNETISSFETNVIYSMLASLPVIDSAGEKASILYKELVANYEVKGLDINDEAYRNFIRNGHVFCKKGGKFEYEKPNVVFYVSNKTYGESIINQFHTIDIDRRKRTEKIEMLFGVKPLKGLKPRLATQPQLHPLNGKFEYEIEHFKPYVYVLRQENDTRGQERALIKNIRFKLVVDLKVALEKDVSATTFDLKPYESLYLPAQKTVYIQTPESIVDEVDLREDVLFCSAVAEAFSALIDVDSHRQQIRELFSKSPSKRDDLIFAEMDEASLKELSRAKEQLGVVNDPKFQFWQAFLNCFPKRKIRTLKGTDHELEIELKKAFPEWTVDIKLLFDELDYENYNEENSLRLIINFFKMTGIALANINRYLYPSIDLLELFNLDWQHLKDKHRTHFKAILHDDFRSNDLERSKFLRILDNYDALDVSHQNEIDYDITASYFKLISEEYGIDLLFETKTDPNAQFEENKQQFLLLAGEAGIPRVQSNAFLDERQDRESMLYFSETIETLIEELKSWSSKTNDGGNGEGGKSIKRKIRLRSMDILFEDLKDLFNQLEGFPNIKTTLNKIRISALENRLSSGSTRKPHAKKGERKPRKQSEDVGFLGEWVVYKHLLKAFENKGAVVWASEYARTVGLNPDGRDGLGYDLVYTPNDGKQPQYIEVKVVGWEDSFHISSIEVSTGERYKKHYDIYLVRSIGDSDEINIEVIPGPFAYIGRSGFNDNSNFTVINDSFILKFRKSK